MVLNLDMLGRGSAEPHDFDIRQGSSPRTKSSILVGPRNVRLGIGTRLGSGQPVDTDQVRLLRRHAGVHQQQHRRQRRPLQEVRLREGAPLEAVLLRSARVPASMHSSARAGWSER